MPHRKRLPPIQADYIDGGKNSENHLIQKSNPLLSLSQTNMTLPELKILDIYLSRIDSHDEDKRTVQLKKGEIESCLGISRILKPDLEKRLRNLAQVVKIEDETDLNGFKLVSLFEEIDAWQDDDGLWQISLTCTSRAREYIFNIDNIGYLRYRLANVINLTSRYSYVLYLYLEHNRYRKSWEIELDELKAMLRCEAETYNQFYRFNDLVLKKCHKELMEKTTLRFTYSSVRRGRAVRTIRFTVETLPPPEVPDQLSFADITTKSDDQIEFLRSACTPSGAVEPEFSRAEIEQLFEVLVMVDSNILPCPKDYPFDIEFRRYHYLRQKYTAMNNRSPKKEPIQHRFSYLLTLVKNDAKTLVGQGVQ